MIQERLIERVRELCEADERLSAALMYGSFVTGEADEHSDVEFWLFGDVEPVEWLRQVATFHHVVVNEFGAHVVFFPGLIRGEFHFADAGDAGAVATWPTRDIEIIVDRTGELSAAVEQSPALGDKSDLSEICGRFANWLVLAQATAARGELLRSLDALTHAQRYLLWMARLAENRTIHWLTPSRAAEIDLPPHVVAALHRATATADPASLRRAFAAAWALGREYWPAPIPEALFSELDARCSPAPPD